MPKYSNAHVVVLSRATAVHVDAEEVDGLGQHPGCIATPRIAHFQRLVRIYHHSTIRIEEFVQAVVRAA